MKKIYTYGGQLAMCHLSLGWVCKNKVAGKRMIQVTAYDAHSEKMKEGLDKLQPVH